MSIKGLDNLTDKEEELLEKFWSAWKEVRDTTGWGEIKVTMQAKRWGHIFKTVSEMHNGKKKDKSSKTDWNKRSAKP